MKHLLLLSIACILLSACAGDPGAYSVDADGTISGGADETAADLASLSQTELSCPVESMRITDYGFEPDGLTRQWAVDCYGERYFCTDRPLSEYTSQTVCNLTATIN